MSYKIPSKTLATAGLPDEGIWRVQVAKAGVVNKTNKEGEEYTVVEAMFKLLERQGDDAPLAFNSVVFDNLSLSIRALPRLNTLISSALGYMPTGEIGEDGTPEIDLESTLESILGSEVWCTIKHEDKGNGQYKPKVGFKFAASPDKLYFAA